MGHPSLGGEAWAPSRRPRGVPRGDWKGGGLWLDQSEISLGGRRIRNTILPALTSSGPLLSTQQCLTAFEAVPAVDGSSGAASGGNRGSPNLNLRFR